MLGKSDFHPCQSDPALFMNRTDPNNLIYLLTYVDDLLIMGKLVDKVSEVKEDLAKYFKIHD